jgi:predicted RNA-binding protein YlxR (DUF448 family)
MESARSRAASPSDKSVRSVAGLSASGTGEADASPPEPTGPVRTCVGCRARATAAELLRVAVVGDALVPDPARRIPGRGAHLHRDPQCYTLALRRKAFPRALRLSGIPSGAAVLDYLSEYAAACSTQSDVDTEGSPIVSTP